MEHLYGRLYGTSKWGGWRILLIGLFSLDPLSQKYTHGNLEGMYEIGSLLWEPQMEHLYDRMMGGYMEWLVDPNRIGLFFMGSSVPEIHTW